MFMVSEMSWVQEARGTGLQYKSRELSFRPVRCLDPPGLSSLSGKLVRAFRVPRTMRH